MTLRALALLALSAAFGAAAAAPTPAPTRPATAVAVAAPLVWTVRGPRGALTIAGSIHALRPADLPLPAEYDLAYARAARLVLEVELDSAAAQAEMQAGVRAGLLPPADSLRTRFGAEDWRAAERAARAARVSLDAVAGFEPWLAALMLTHQALLAAGLDPDRGLDQQLLRRARADGKPVLGLERAADQLALFDALPAAEQNRYLLLTLADLDQVPGELDRDIRAWRDGDLGYWAKPLAELAALPTLRRELLDARHARWLPQLERMLAEPTPTLVVVGTLHLVGERSLLADLAGRGYAIERGLPP